MLKREPRRCPWCFSDTYGKAIGIEVQGLYDGVAYYRCPHCSRLYSRQGNPLTEGEAVNITRPEIFTK